jgi:hypothetical protein
VQTSLGKVRALAAEQVLHVRFAIGLAIAEGVNPLAGFRVLDCAQLQNGLGSGFFRLLGLCNPASLGCGGFPVTLGLGFRLYHERLTDGFGHCVTLP